MVRWMAGASWPDREGEDDSILCRVELRGAGLALAPLRRREIAAAIKTDVGGICIFLSVVFGCNQEHRA